MNTTQWASASYKASAPLSWYDRLTIVLIILGALVAVFGWLVFDGTRPI